MVFTADSLMAMGCGRLFEGDAPMMWASLSRLNALPARTLVCSGHDCRGNGAFAVGRAGRNPALRQRIEDTAAGRRPAAPRRWPMNARPTRFCGWPSCAPCWVWRAPRMPRFCPAATDEGQVLKSPDRDANEIGCVRLTPRFRICPRSRCQMLENMSANHHICRNRGKFGRGGRDYHLNCAKIHQILTVS